MALNKDVLGLAMHNKANTYNNVEIDVHDAAAVEQYRQEFWKGMADEIIKHFKTSGVVNVNVTTTGTASAHTGTGIGTIS